MGARLCKSETKEEEGSLASLCQRFHGGLPRTLSPYDMHGIGSSS